MPTRLLSVSGPLPEPTVGTSLVLLALTSRLGRHSSRFHNTEFMFQRKEYTNIEVVSSEKKGYRFQAASDISQYAYTVFAPPGRDYDSHGT